MAIPTRPAPAVPPGHASFRAAAVRVAAFGFVAAVVLQALALAAADPLELRWAAQVLGWPLPVVQLAAFLVFWAVSSAAAVVGCLAWLAAGAWQVRTRWR